MHRVKASGSVPFASRDIAPVTGTPQYFTSGVPGVTAATVLPGYWVDMVMDEICAVITAAGITLDDTDWGQLLKALGTLYSPFSGRAIFSASGNFTVPARVTRLRRVGGWGGGGGGGGATNNGDVGAGAGSGEYREGGFAVTPGAVLPVTIGAAGAAGAIGGNGGDAGDTILGDGSGGTLLRAKGGLHGNGSNGGGVVGGFGAGGTGGIGGDLTIAGGIGGIGFIIAGQGTYTGQGGPAWCGNFHYGLTPAGSSSNGGPAFGPGGGGAGGVNGGGGGATGGAGQAGFLFIEW